MQVLDRADRGGIHLAHYSDNNSVMGQQGCGFYLGPHIQTGGKGLAKLWQGTVLLMLRWP